MFGGCIWAVAIGVVVASSVVISPVSSLFLSRMGCHFSMLVMVVGGCGFCIWFAIWGWCLCDKVKAWIFKMWPMRL